MSVIVAVGGTGRCVCVCGRGGLAGRQENVCVTKVVCMVGERRRSCTRYVSQQAVV